MNRTARILAATLVLALVGAASVLAAPSERAQERRNPVASSHQPASPDDADEVGETNGDGPSQQLLDRLVDRLDAAEVETTAEEIASLAETHGVGGAVRILAWAAAAGMDPAAIAAMFDDEAGMGWGEIAKQLNEANEGLDL
ncbi:MAG: hypothetical protein ACRDHD_07470, partial [Candidatus Limnocylindria bacterium]